MKLQLAGLMGVVLILHGCVSTKMTSMLNPEWSPTPYDRVLVFYPAEDLEVRQLVEVRFSERTAGQGVDFVPAHQILFPGRTYSEEELRSTLEDSEIDAILVVVQGQAGYSTAVLPGSSSSSTRCTTWTSSQGCVSTSTTTTQTGGGTVRKPWSEFSLVLVDFNTYETAWVATARSGGNAFSDVDDLVDSMVVEALKHLREDGVFDSVRR